MSRDVYSVITAPLVTEKATLVNNLGNQVIFRVRPDANKFAIKNAIETLFKVKVKKVRTMITPGKTRRMGRFEGKRGDVKKAIVTLKAGSKIDFTEEGA